MLNTVYNMRYKNIIYGIFIYFKNENKHMTLHTSFTDVNCILLRKITIVNLKGA